MSEDTGTKIGVITHPASLLQGEINVEYNACFTTGLTVATSSTDDITIIWE